MIIINKSERDLIGKFLYFYEERLIQSVKDCEYRYTRRNLDSIDLLEEIIAKERLTAFRDFAFDVINLLKLNESDCEIANRFKIHEGFENCTIAKEDNKKDIKEMLG